MVQGKSAVDEAFDVAITRILGFEGGYGNNPNDPGGETNFGISKRSYPDLDIRNLTREEAIGIYKRDFWVGSRLDQLSPRIGGATLDLSVNMGLRAAVKLLQHAMVDCGATLELDGRLGPRTINASSRVELVPCLAALRWRACLFYLAIVEGRQSSSVFLKGWLRRACALQ